MSTIVRLLIQNKPAQKDTNVDTRILVGQYELASTYHKIFLEEITS